MNDTWFAWSGPTTVTPGRNGTAYYRIQGPNLVIEYAPQPLGGDPIANFHEATDIRLRVKQGLEIKLPPSRHP